jgi:DNA-binding transcriptional regulator YdaS (Cro superfamily)
MNLAEWLEAPGRVTAMARHFDLTHSAVSQWKKNGVPLRHMRAVSEFTSGEVSLESLMDAAINAASERAEAT